jgi:hypothetical protein
MVIEGSGRRLNSCRLLNRPIHILPLSNISLPIPPDPTVHPGHWHGSSLRNVREALWFAEVRPSSGWHTKSGKASGRKERVYMAERGDFIVDHDVTRSRFGRLPNREGTPKFAANCWARMKDPRMLNKSATRQGGITVGCLACKICRSWKEISRPEEWKAGRSWARKHRDGSQRFGEGKRGYV